MNYLGHFVYNHGVCGIPVEPYFAVGVALPDLWPRFSRTRRLRWPAIRAASPTEPAAVQLRAGLLNHVATDRAFHVLPCFLGWQRHLKQEYPAGRQPESADAPGVHPWLLDFVTHAALELTLDHLLVQAEPRLADRFYETLAAAEAEVAAAVAGQFGAVNTEGLAGALRGFVARGYLRRYATLAGLEQALRLCVELAPNAATLPAGLLTALLAAAARLVQPARVWSELGVPPPAA